MAGYSRHSDEEGGSPQDREGGRVAELIGCFLCSTRLIHAV
jgi:hypothetical protein